MTTRKNTVFNNLKYVDEGKNEKERIARLYEVNNITIKQLLDYTFNPKIQWVLEENIKYVPSKDEPRVLISALQSDVSKLHTFLNIGMYANLDKRKKTNLFIQTLQNIHPDDAVLMMSIKDKKLPFKNLNAAFFKKAYPNGFPKNW